MESELPDQLRQLWRDFERTQEQLPDLARSLAQVVGVGGSPDGVAEARCDARGSLIGLEFNPGRFGRTESHALSEAVLHAAAAARQDAARQADELSAQLPFGSFSQLLRGEFQTPQVVEQSIGRLQIATGTDRER